MKVSKFNSKNKNQPTKQTKKQTYLAVTCGDVQPHEHGVQENKERKRTEYSRHRLFAFLNRKGL